MLTLFSDLKISFVTKDFQVKFKSLVAKRIFNLVTKLFFRLFFVAQNQIGFTKVRGQIHDFRRAYC